MRGSLLLGSVHEIGFFGIEVVTERINARGRWMRMRLVWWGTALLATLEPSVFRVLVVLTVLLMLDLIWHMRHGPRVSPF